ncbi:hypothetical protein RFI_24481 [Reticulomyxa filosa]|uniref:Uncharacterized protein n=1 Tax=Reticulomyxa filosa TaxID=46433 RepID=X6MGA1_RETFI|nr:hypothetical protein RFI_24481 [Reticulomyxa filosa]|eukprot:ETO12894.1 hypothetical protein RFI_24481 [Reticulomyxa filosa]
MVFYKYPPYNHECLFEFDSTNDYIQFKNKIWIQQRDIWNLVQTITNKKLQFLGAFFYFDFLKYKFTLQEKYIITSFMIPLLSFMALLHDSSGIAFVHSLPKTAQNIVVALLQRYQQQEEKKLADSTDLKLKE